jgi:lysophospholipase L1-like esterase
VSWIRARRFAWGTIVAVAVLAVAWVVAAPAGARRLHARSSSAIVVGLGDSLASGEGNPDVPVQNGKPAQWENRRCDRSNKSFESQVADRLKNRNPNTPVKFLYLACSGASIVKGLLGPYAGINPSNPDLPAQVTEAKRLVGDQKADAVLLSIGVNDLEFGAVAFFCASSGKNGYCPDNKYKNGLTLSQWMAQQLKELPGRFDRLAEALKPLVADDRVFINEYPDLVSMSPTELCKLIHFRPGYVYGDYEIKAKEIDWLYHQFYLPLNAVIHEAAVKHGWTAIEPPEAFHDHGYCTNDTWIVTYKQSNERQGDGNGTLHPNLQGHNAITDAFYPIVSKALGLLGRPRPGRPRGGRPHGGLG